MGANGTSAKASHMAKSNVHARGVYIYSWIRGNIEANHVTIYLFINTVEIWDKVYSEMSSQEKPTPNEHMYTNWALREAQFVNNWPKKAQIWELKGQSLFQASFTFS